MVVSVRASVLAWARANFAALGEAVETDLHDWSEREFERIAGFPPQGPTRIKTALRAASLRMAPADWFSACAAHDPQAGQASRPPRLAKP